ncbi:flagellar hook-associated protein 1 FlgK [Sphaerotilus hippei]|uniref:Flagellar hook-associated protein 1 n=1 Tax=Sphaerotilus hippei TaxID=744406 RepID=A0A318H439_9BURK|nr:flagellar hook-associated protein FlgK [Sphaerotilus hippei]PXW93710.1 flagellar hook-associated protein 1 FlgK [Sphaerotilus hippei]
MSTSSLLSLGANAMFAAQSQLQTTGHNISNASVAGYSRQEAKLSTVQGQYTGSGYVGRGVSVQTVTRAVNSFLTDAAAQTSSVAAADKAHSTLLAQLQDSIGIGEQGLGQAATSFFNALNDVAALPSDTSARQVALARADDLASMFRSTSDQIESLQSSVTQDVMNSVGTVNELSERIAQLNGAIAGTNGGTHSANDLLDQRDQLIKELSQYVQVSRISQDDGSVNLFIGGGQSLVLGNQSNGLKASLDPFDATRVQIEVEVSGVSRPLSEASLGGGSLAGLMRFQEQDLNAARAQLGQLGAGLTAAVNGQQRAGFTLDGVAGSAMFTELAGNVIASRDNAGSGLASLQGLMSLSTPSALQAAEYELKAGASGTFTLRKLPDGDPETVTDGQEIDGFTLELSAATSPAVVEGDRFLLQPVSLAAQKMRQVLNDPDDVAGANSVVLKAGSSNTGTATIKSVLLDGSSTPTGVSIAFGAATADGARAYTLTDSGTTPATTVSGSWKAGESVSYDGMTVTFDGVPAQGDTFTTQATSQWGANNGNALALADLANGKLVDGSTFTDAFSHLLSDIGARVQTAETAYEVSSGVATRAEEQLGASTGVNLDEEAAKLLQYQQAYQAAAKILQVAQKVFDTVLSLAN